MESRVVSDLSLVRRLGVWGGILLIPAVVCLVYVNSTRGSFHLDDMRYIPTSAQSTQPLQWMAQRSLVQLTLIANIAVFGYEPSGYLLVNVAIHAGSAVLLFLLIRIVIQKRLPDLNASGYAMVVALIWGVHPLNTQAVNYIIQRCESLMGLFFLATVLCHAHGIISGRKRWFLVAGMCFLAGANCKEPIWMAPLVLVFFEWLILRCDWSDLKTRGTIYLMYLVPALGLALYFVPEAIIHDPTIGGSADEAAVSSLRYLMTQGAVIAHYLRLSVLPTNLCFDYAWQIAETPADVLPAALVIVGLFVLTVWRALARDWRAMLGIWFFLILAPSSSFIPIADVAVEHRMYLPLISVVVVFTSAIHWVSKTLCSSLARQRFCMGILTAVLVLTLGIRTFVRNRDYETEVTLWQSVIATEPMNARAYNNLAIMLLSQGRVIEALHMAKQCLEHPRFASLPPTALGETLRFPGVVDQAIALFQDVDIQQTSPVEIQFLLGQACDRARVPKQAEHHFLRAVRLRPDDPDLRVSLAAVQADQGKLADAEENLAAALLANPTHEPAICNRGVLEAMQGNFPEAERWFVLALKHNPDCEDAKGFLKRLKDSPAPQTGKDVQ